MSHRRILSLWFPRLAAERVLRLHRHGLPLDLGPQPFAIVADDHGAQILSSLNLAAEHAGLSLGQPLRDATAMCPGLLTRAADPLREAEFLTHLRRWAAKFSPWVAEEAPDGLVIDLTGCAHLFGGEAQLLTQVEQDCADIGMSLRAAIADTRGAAWALARHAGRDTAPHRTGDSIDQEARATRSRAAKRRGWERGGDAPLPGRATLPVPQGIIAPPGRLREALGPLPIAALRIPPDAVEGLARLGLRRIEEIAVLPRAALSRRFGAEVLRRLDQALGLDPEPVAPARAPLHFATRLTLPDPIGLRTDVEAAIDRLLPPLCDKLRAQGRGARIVRLEAYRADGSVQRVEVGLARPADRPDRIRPLLALKLDTLDAGFGFDCIRMEAVLTEVLHAVQHRGQIEAGAAAAARPTENTALADLLGKLGARLGSDAVTRMHPGASHLPEKAAITLAAAWSEPWNEPWPAPRAPRPLVMFRPEMLALPEGDPTPPAQFRWRRRDLVTRVAAGPERILPEWWLDDPDWRSGPRDYWRIEATNGERLWLYHAHGGEVSGGWFVHGAFA
jgi:protein ImuB